MRNYTVVLGPNLKYPDFWPQPDKLHPEYVQSRITEEQKIALYNRQITTRELATILGVSERHLSTYFTGKCPIPDKKELTKARREYKIELAKEVLQGKYTVKQASKIAYTSYSTMLRRVKEAAKRYPELQNVSKFHSL